MSTPRPPQSTIHLVLVVLVLSLGLNVPARAADAVLDAVPADSLICVRINNINGTLMKTDQFLAGVSPIGVSMFARMGLIKVLGSPMLTGVDMNGDFSLFVTSMPSGAGQAGPMPSVAIAGLIPVTDYTQFVSGTPSISDADSDGISQLTVEGTPGMLVGSAGKFALVGPDQDRQAFMQLKKQIVAKSKPISSSLGTKLARESGSQSLWLYCNIQAVNKTFGPLIQMQLQQAKAMMAGGATQQTGGIDPAKVVDAYGEMFDMFLKQASHITVSLDATADALRLNESIVALPGTDMAKALINTNAQENKLLGYFDSTAFMNVGFTMNSPLWEEITEWSMDFTAAMFGEAMAGGKAEEMKTMMSDMMDAMGKCGVFSMSMAKDTKPAFSVRSAFDTADPQKYLQLLAKAFEFYGSSFEGIYEDMGLGMQFDHKPQAQTYNGVSIDTSKLSFDVKDSDTNEAQMIRTMYGDGFDYRWAAVGKTCLNSVGGGADKGIRALIDKAKSGTPAIQSETKTALDIIPGARKADMFATLNALKLYGLISSMAPIPLPQMDVPTKSSIVMAAQTGDSRVSIDVVLPKAHLSEIMTLVNGIMMQQMGQGAGAN
jgi:hypothetical protein